MNIQNINQRQFEKTMSRESQTVIDYYNGTSYTVFFRKARTNSFGEVNLFYDEETYISIGTVFTYKGNNYIVTTKNRIESANYFNSIAIKSTEIIGFEVGTTWNNIPIIVDNKQFDVEENQNITVINGAITVYTGKNLIVESIEIGNSFNIFGGTYKVCNMFYNDGIAYFYMIRVLGTVPDSYSLVYSGETILDINENTYQLSYVATTNGEVQSNPTLTYVSGNDTIATVDTNGLLTIVANGIVEITTTWTEGNVSCVTSITVNGEIPVTGGTSQISGVETLNLELTLGRTYTSHFYDSTNTEVMGITPIWTLSNFSGCSLSDFRITYPSSSTVKIVCSDIENYDLQDATFNLNLTDDSGIYVSSSKTITLVVL